MKNKTRAYRLRERFLTLATGIESFEARDGAAVLEPLARPLLDEAKRYRTEFKRRQFVLDLMRPALGLESDLSRLLERVASWRQQRRSRSRGIGGAQGLDAALEALKVDPDAALSTSPEGRDACASLREARGRNFRLPGCPGVGRRAKCASRQSEGVR